MSPQDFEKLYRAVRHLGTIDEEALQRAYIDLTKHEKGCLTVTIQCLAKMVEYDLKH